MVLNLRCCCHNVVTEIGSVGSYADYYTLHYNVVAYYAVDYIDSLIAADYFLIAASVDYVDIA